MSMRIKRIEVVQLEASFAQLFGGSDKVPPSLLFPGASFASRPRFGQASTLVRITTDDGFVGVGEAWGLPSPSIPAVIIEEVFAPMLIGADPFTTSVHWDRMYGTLNRMGNTRGFAMEAMSAIDMACWDLKGRMTGMPIHALLGGRHRERIDCYASPVYFFDEPAESAAKALEYVNEGFRAVKVKAGRSIETDLAHLAAVQDAVGPDVKLLVDMNCAYDVRTAITLARELESFNILWFEEPIPPEDAEGLLAIHRAIRIPLATGENEFTPQGFRDMLRLGAVDIIMPNVTRAGGFTGLDRIAKLAEAFSVKLALHGVGSGVQVAAAVQAMAAYGNAYLYEYNRLLNPLREALIEPFPAFADGALVVPDGPGLGVELNSSTVDQYTISTSVKEC